MPDGVKLAVTWWRPTPKDSGETFPVLLELLALPQRRFVLRPGLPAVFYFAGHGFIMAKVDIRGTGGSEGHLPEREYSDQELADALEIIKQIARSPRSNGKVGMWGISWGGFNALQVAMLHPPELKAIVALHASDDLYHDDIHYIDGALHVDWYALQIDHENALPRNSGLPARFRLLSRPVRGRALDLHLPEALGGRALVAKTCPPLELLGDSDPDLLHRWTAGRVSRYADPRLGPAQGADQGRDRPVEPRLA